MMFLQQSNSQQTITEPKKAMLGFLFSLIGAILILVRGIVLIVRGDIITFVGSDEVRRRFLAGIALNLIGGVAIVFAILIIVSAYLLYAGMATAGGIMVIVFSALSIFVGSGWLIGLILGLIGGILGLLKQ
jgi:hypothetical protein